MCLRVGAVCCEEQPVHAVRTGSVRDVGLQPALKLGLLLKTMI